MSRTLALGIVAVAVLVALGLLVQLWRSRRSSPGPWSRQDSFTALGLLVAVLGIVVPLLVADGEGADAESPEVHAYRQDVRSACASLHPTSNPLTDAMTGQNFDRDRLLDGFRNQLRATSGVLDGLWAQQVPDELATEAHAARAAAQAFLRVSRQEFDRLEGQLPPQLSFQEVSALSGQLDADLRPASSRLDAAMSRLADQQCLGPSQSPAS